MQEDPQDEKGAWFLSESPTESISSRKESKQATYNEEIQ